MTDTPELDPERARALRAMILDDARLHSSSRSSGPARASRPHRVRPGVIVFASVATAAVVVAGGAGLTGLRSTHTNLPEGHGVVVPAQSASPTPSTSATPGYVEGAGTPSPTPLAPTVADADRMVLHAQEIDLEKGGTLITSVSMLDTSKAVATLTALLGAPTITDQTPPAGDVCTPQATIYRWGSALTVTDRKTAVTASNPDFSVSFARSSVVSAAKAIVQLEAPNGLQVGQNYASELAAAPADRKDVFDGPNAGQSDLLLESGWNDPTATVDVTGLVASAQDDIVQYIGTPLAVRGGDC